MHSCQSQEIMHFQCLTIFCASPCLLSQYKLIGSVQYKQFSAMLSTLARRAVAGAVRPRAAVCAPVLKRTIWSDMPMGPADPILGLTDAFNKDASPNKVSLGVGAYRYGRYLVNSASKLRTSSERSASFIQLLHISLTNCYCCLCTIAEAMMASHTCWTLCGKLSRLCCRRT
jgi:hypothetical protein